MRGGPLASEASEPPELAPESRPASAPESAPGCASEPGDDPDSEPELASEDASVPELPFCEPSELSLSDVGESACASGVLELADPSAVDPEDPEDEIEHPQMATAPTVRSIVHRLTCIDIPSYKGAPGGGLCSIGTIHRHYCVVTNVVGAITGDST